MCQCQLSCMMHCQRRQVTMYYSSLLQKFLSTEHPERRDFHLVLTFARLAAMCWKILDYWIIGSPHVASVSPHGWGVYLPQLWHMGSIYTVCFILQVLYTSLRNPLSSVVVLRQTATTRKSPFFLFYSMTEYDSQNGLCRWDIQHRLFHYGIGMVSCLRPWWVWPSSSCQYLIAKLIDH